MEKENTMNQSAELLKSVKKLIAQGRFLSAKQELEALRKSGLIKPADEWQLHELYGAVFFGLVDAEGIAAAYFNAAKADVYLRSQREHYANYLFALHYLPGLSAIDLAEQHFASQNFYRKEELLPARKIIPHDKLRLGFLSADFLESSAARFYEILLRGIPENVADIYAYSLSKQTDAFTNKIKSEVKYSDFSHKSIEAAAMSIRADEIDILIDLTGQAAGGMTLMILAKKPAPVNICGIGWFDTTGLNFVDAIWTDKKLSPDSEMAAVCFTEKLYYLPAAFCFRPTLAMKKIILQPRKRRAVVFGCYQNFLKINKDVMNVWRQILQRLPKSKLILQDTTNLTERRTAMKQRLVAADLPIERIEIRLGSDNYLADYHDIDIMLGTFPYPGGASTAIALYMGVPVVTLAGLRYSARFGVSLLTAAGLPEFIASDYQEYIKIAVNLASDEAGLINYQQNLRKKLEASTLMNEKAYIKSFIQFCSDLWQARGDFSLCDRI